MDDEGEDTEPPVRSRRGVLVALGAGGLWVLGAESVAMRIRRSLLPPLDPILRQVGGYTAYQLHEDEFIGVTEAIDDEAALKALEYEPSVLAAAKYHPRSARTDDGSWRRIDPDNPRWQWHVHRWRRHDGSTELFSHYEYRPDLRPIAGESPAELYQRIRDHYYPRWNNQFPDEDANYFLGEASAGLEELIEG